MTSPSSPDDESDAALLRRFQRGGDEEAFAALVRRWLPVLEGCARRMTGDAELSRDAVQRVFCLLARKAGRVAAHSAPGAWLHRAVTLECRGLLRRETTQRRTAQRYAAEIPSAMNDMPHPEAWEQALPHLDDAINALPAAERELIVQRFFELQSWNAIGASRDRSPDAARMAMAPALEKLARALRARGVTVGAGVLTAGLAGLTQSAPAAAARVSAIVQAAVPLRSAGRGFAIGTWGTAAAGFLIAAPLTWLAAKPVEPAAPPGNVSPPFAAHPDKSGGAAPPVSASSAAYDLTALLAGIQRLAPSGNDPEEVVRLRAMLMDMPASDVPQVHAAMKTRRWFTDTRLVAEAFFGRWAELDAAAAFEAAKAEEFTGAALTAISAINYTPGVDPAIVVRGLARADWWPAGHSEETRALFAGCRWKETASSLTFPEDLSKLGHVMACYADMKDPAVREVLLPLTEKNVRLTTEVAKAWAAVDGEGPLAWLQTLPRDSARYYTTAIEIAQAISGHDPARAVSIIRGIPFADNYREGYRNVWKAWLKKDPAAAEAALEQEGLTPEGMELFRNPKP